MVRPRGQPSFFLYQPNDYANACDGGGRLISHVETPIGIITGELEIPPNVTLDQHLYWSGTMIEDLDNVVPYTCPDHEWKKGYCLFDSEDVYGEGVKLRDPIIASYCKTRFYHPPIDTDGDGIPDDEDPCPLNPDVFCDGNDDDDNGGGPPGGGDIDEDGCQTTFFPDECKLAIVCPDAGATYIDGVTQTESYAGTDPCIHCFTADVCRVVHPETGEEYSEIVGPISGSVTVELVDIPECSGICGIWFTCTATGAFIDYIRAPDCITTNDPVCGFSDLYTIVSLLQEEDAPQSIEVEMTKELALQIINANGDSRNAAKSTEILETLPNPSHNGFVVKYDSNTAYSTDLVIRNVYKEKVYTEAVHIKKGINEFVVDQGLIPGVYVISINNLEKIISTKHVVHSQ